MEGPSLVIAAENLAPLIGSKILKVEGNTKIGKERLDGLTILDIFSWGKHLVFQFEGFALRVHFMLFGSYEAVINRKRVTGDYKRTQVPRLSLKCKKGTVLLFNCSLKFIESAHSKEEYDFSRDTMSSLWDAKQALDTIRTMKERQIGDVLLDQSIFAGVGNIIKNEVLFIEKVPPEQKIAKIPVTKLKKIIAAVPPYCKNFYTWRKAFELKKHYQIYHQSLCPLCKEKVTRKKTGLSARWSFFCTTCQSL